MNGYEESIKDRLFLEIYNASLVKEGCRLVCERREDLAVVCRLAGYDEEFHRDCQLVVKEQLEHWGIEETVLFQDAWENTLAKHPPMLIGSYEVRRGNYDHNILKTEEKCCTADAEFYALIKNIGHGAVYMMDEGTMQKCAELLEGNLIVLPASIHEAYLLVEREDMDLDRIRNTVHTVNGMFPAEEYLSDEIYRYDRVRNFIYHSSKRPGRICRNGTAVRKRR